MKIVPADLRGTPFPRLWLGETASMLGTQFTTLAIPLLALYELGADVMQMSLLNSAGDAAVLVFGLSAGVLADRYERVGIMLVANAGRVLVLLAIPLAYLMGWLSIPMLVICAFAIGTGSILFDSAYSGYVPKLLTVRQLGTANSYFQASQSSTDVAGPGVAGLLVQLIGAPLVVLVDAISYVVSTICLLRLPRFGPGADEEEEATHLSAIKSGLGLVWRDRVLRATAVSAGHSNIFHGMFYSVFLIFLARDIGLSSGLIGLIFSVGGVAGVLCAPLSAKIVAQRDWIAVIAVAYFLPGVFALLVPLTTSMGHLTAIILVTLAEIGWVAAVVVNLIVSETLKQAITPDSHLSRVTSTIRFISWGVEPIGALLGGVLAIGVLGHVGTLVLASAGLATAAVWWLVLPPTDRARVQTMRSARGGDASDAPAIG